MSEGTEHIKFFQVYSFDCAAQIKFIYVWLCVFSLPIFFFLFLMSVKIYVFHQIIKYFSFDASENIRTSSNHPVNVSHYIGLVME